MPTAEGFFWRRIGLRPDAGGIVAGLEDDVHRFRLRIGHHDDRVTTVDVHTDRTPYSTCAGAGPHVAEELVGRRLHDVAMLDASSHCTHLLDLAAIAARHAADVVPSCFDMRVADRKERRTTALLDVNQANLLAWQLDGTTIMAPPGWRGRDLRRFADWRDELTCQERAGAAMLRRAVMVSGARALPFDGGMAAGPQPGRAGACFTHSAERRRSATRARDWRRDFSAGTDGPLADFLDEERNVMSAGE